MTKTNKLLVADDTFSIRKAMPEDAQALQELMLETARWLKEKGSSQWNEILQGKDVHNLSEKTAANEVFLVQSQDGQVAGSMIIQESPNDWDKALWQEETANKAHYLHRLMVARAFSGQHLSQAMIQFAATFTISEQVPRLRLDTKKDVPVLNQLYQSAGFTLKGIQNGYSLYEKILINP
ncbi:GNAT family N-acetyltransferase [Listeria aquatica]|uniref:GNAT family N-acetyltransferase n=1 Tax=Listeria aquatica TaxID=1494960 RepID=A0A841ZRK7_9LIST|nr:GNAT family N-acetyltransferase [Listeria aquatica]MBC1522034.1 GNAT family N-acetyltransferase [Listeria aquatica]